MLLTLLCAVFKTICDQVHMFRGEYFKAVLFETGQKLISRNFTIFLGS